MTVNVNGAFYNEVRYTAFGETRYTSGGETLTDRLYTGQRLEEELGLYYYNARFYDPYLNHFVQADTMTPNPGYSLTYDKYAYGNQNPLAYTDPSGHWPEWFDWLQGATYQYANDVTLGAMDQIAYALDVCMECNRSTAYQQGQQAGRVAAIVQASVEEVIGVAAVGVALAGIGPTAGGSLALAPVTVGGSLAIGGVVVSGEVALGVGGAVTAVHGLAVAAFTANNPLSGGRHPSIDDLLKDPNSFAGKTQAEIEVLIPSTWEKSPLAKGEGVRYLNPDKPGQALFFEQGWPNAKDPLHAGPYLKISTGTGKPIRIPLAGNPLLK